MISQLVGNIPPPSHGQGLHRDPYSCWMTLHHYTQHSRICVRLLGGAVCLTIAARLTCASALICCVIGIACSKRLCRDVGCQFGRELCFGLAGKPFKQPPAYGCDLYQLRVELAWSCRTKLLGDRPLRQCSEVTLNGVHSIANFLRQSAASHGLKVSVPVGPKVVLLSRM